MSTAFIRYKHKLRTWLFVLGSVLIFFLFRNYFEEQYPDWISYKYIYENQDSNFRINKNDFVFNFMMDVGTYFKLKYENFRLILLIFTSWIFIKSINKFGLKFILFFTLFNIIIIFFQFRQGLAASLIYFSSHIISSKKKFFIDFIALFTHFGSVLPIILSKLNKKIIATLLIIILVTFPFLIEIYTQFFINYFDVNYAHHSIQIIKYKDQSVYYFLTPLFYLIMAKKVANGGLINKFIICLLLFIILHPLLFSDLAIPPILFNSFYRILIIYLSLMLLSKKLKPSFMLFLIVFLIISKDLISSQISYAS